MPNLVGLNYQEAQDSLQAAGIYQSFPVYAFLSSPQISIVWQQVKGEAGGLVVSQAPASGTQNVALGASVTLTISAFPMASVISPGY